MRCSAMFYGPLVYWTRNRTNQFTGGGTGFRFQYLRFGSAPGSPVRTAGTVILPPARSRGRPGRAVMQNPGTSPPQGVAAP